MQDHFGGVEDHIADPPAQDDPERGVEDQIVGVAPRHWGAGLREQLQQIPPTDQDPGDVGDRIPAEREEADREDVGMQPEIVETDMPPGSAANDGG